MLYLHRYKIIAIVFALALFSGSSSAQRNLGGSNYQRFSSKPFYFGLSFGYIDSNFKIKRSRDFIQSDTFLVAEGINNPGFAVNFIGNLKFGKYLDFRTLPGFAFGERTIRYVPKEGTAAFIQEKIESVFIEVPFQFRYKSQPYKNKRIFVSAGVKYSYDVSSNSRNNKASTLIRLTPHDFAAEVGAGVQIFFKYFIFSPEIRYSQGLNSIHIENSDLERSSILDKLISRSLSIRINLEG